MLIFQNLLVKQKLQRARPREELVTILIILGPSRWLWVEVVVIIMKKLNRWKIAFLFFCPCFFSFFLFYYSSFPLSSSSLSSLFSPSLSLLFPLFLSLCVPLSLFYPPFLQVLHFPCLKISGCLVCIPFVLLSPIRSFVFSLVIDIIPGFSRSRCWCRCSHRISYSRTRSRRILCRKWFISSSTRCFSR